MKNKIIISILAALAVSALPASAASFVYNDFTSAAGLTLLGNATISGGDLRTTSAAINQVGAAWYNTPVNVVGGFDSYFQFQITNRGGYTPDWSLTPGTTGGDGFAFVIQGVDTSQIGAYASGLGYFYIPDSLAVAFDTWQNIPSYCEPSNNYISVHSEGVLPNRPENCAGSDFNGPFANPNLGLVNVASDLSNGSIYSVRINYVPGTLSVYLGDLYNPILSVAVNLATKLNLQQGANAFVGFTSSTGGAFENHDIVNWALTNTPEPQTWLLTAIGLIALVIRRRL